MTKEMRELRKMLDAEGIDWHDASELGIYPIWRTHFEHRRVRRTKQGEL